MSTRKIIFLVIIGIIGLLALYGIWNLSQARQKEKTETVASISVWVVGDTSEQYQNIFSGFGEFDTRYEDTSIDVRVFPDYEQYQRILLSTLSEGTGPDIFMVEGGGDDILSSKVLPIPEPVIDLTDFEKKYEDIFLPLISSEGEGEEMVRSLLGVPLGYETLGMFYHKSLLRSVPRTWAELETLTIESENGGVFPSNLGLGPTYTPMATDIIAYFMGKEGNRTTETLQNGSSDIRKYLDYANTSILVGAENTEEGTLESRTLLETRKEMSDSLLSTVDLFMRGRIAILIGYPSLIREIEKAEKRAEDELYDSLILTDRLPQDSLGKNATNIARYRYLGISGKTLNPDASASLLSYLMSDLGEAKIRESFPLLISPVRSRSELQKNTPLSKVFARTRLDAFLPGLEEEVFVYSYGLKSEYEKMFREYIDRNENIDINNIIKLLKKNIDCDIESVLGGTLSEKCMMDE